MSDAEIEKLYERVMTNEEIVLERFFYDKDSDSMANHLLKGKQVAIIGYELSQVVYCHSGPYALSLYFTGGVTDSSSLARFRNI